MKRTPIRDKAQNWDVSLACAFPCSCPEDCEARREERREKGAKRRRFEECKEEREAE